MQECNMQQNMFLMAALTQQNQNTHRCEHGDMVTRSLQYGGDRGNAKEKW
jgi:hypothetical protein